MRVWASRLVTGGLLAAVGIPVLQVAWLRVADPLFTWTMVGVARQHRADTGTWRWPSYHPRPLEGLADGLPRAAVASEDGLFWHHHGFDFGAIAGAVRANREGGTLRGGSTISQQVARNAFLWQERSWARKALEVGYTVLLEALVPKERILEVYLNVAQTGPLQFGAQAGARHWFDRDASALHADQAARLIAVLPAPHRWDPRGSYAGKRASSIRRNAVAFPGDSGFDAAAAKAAPRVRISALWTD